MQCAHEARRRVAHLYRADSRLVRRSILCSLSGSLCGGRARLGCGPLCGRVAELGRRHDRRTPTAFQLRRVEVKELLRGLAHVQQQLGAGKGELAQDPQRAQHAVRGREVGEAEALLCPRLRICGALPAASRQAVRRQGVKARAGFGGPQSAQLLRRSRGSHLRSSPHVSSTARIRSSSTSGDILPT